MTTSVGSSYRSNNVIILGAGASFDAGIPLLGTFVDKIWEYSARGKVGEVEISPHDRIKLGAADLIRRSLEPYNSRANFNSRNIEDVLSLLSFEAMRGGVAENRYDAVVAAVERTIDLSCKITRQDCDPDNVFHRKSCQPHLDLWKHILSRRFRQNLPAIVTFNYDLVLERTLWQSFHFSKNTEPPEFESCGINYHLGDTAFGIRKVPPEPNGPAQHASPNRQGTKGEWVPFEETEAKIHYFKLHGSLNWDGNNPSKANADRDRLTTEPAPFILPPVFNKINSEQIRPLWSEALDVLQHAKYVTIVGYSLPQTDIYMQYFRRSAFGPNSDLQQITVFDPVLFKDGDPAGEGMRRRYRECFAPQFWNYICFRPHFEGGNDQVKPHYRSEAERDGTEPGTFRHFVEELRKEATSRRLFYHP